MKKTIALLAVIAITTPAFAVEPLLFEPLNPIEVPQLETVAPAEVAQPVQVPTVAEPNAVQISFPLSGSEISGTYNANMVPQNAAAEGKPVLERVAPKVRVRTKQRSQGNSYWNAGGKGTKSYF